MVNVVQKPCLYDSCTRRPSFNVQGVKMPAFCKQHAQDSMVNVVAKPCSYDFCTRRPSWGVLAGGEATVCADHKSSLTECPVVNFRAPCKAVGCRSPSTWGLRGEQPSHCRQH
ncbi:unnamed protein product, partial [Scytosiphon promiscuus]